MQVLLDLLGSLFNPVVRIYLAIVAPVALVLGAIANPGGAINGLACRAIDLVADVWPSTPDNLKIATLLGQVGGNSIIGYGIFLDIAQMVGSFFAIVVLVKIYKLIPFKAS